MGTTQKSLAAGVPVCVIPFLRDQFEIARRVEVAEAWSSLPARKLRPDRLRTAVRKAMSQREGVQRIAEAFRNAAGPEGAAYELERLLR